MSSLIKAYSKDKIGGEEEEIDFNKYLIDDSDDSDLSSSEDEKETGGGMSIMGGESIISAKDLIDNNLT